MNLKKTLFHKWYLFEIIGVIAFAAIIGELFGRFVSHDRPLRPYLLTILAIETIVAIAISRREKYNKENNDNILR